MAEAGGGARAVRRPHLRSPSHGCSCSAAWAIAFLTLLLMRPGRLAHAVKDATRERPGYGHVKFRYYRLLSAPQDLMFTLSFTVEPKPTPGSG